MVPAVPEKSPVSPGSEMDAVVAMELPTKLRGKQEELSNRANLIPFSARQQVMRTPLGELSEFLSHPDLQTPQWRSIIWVN
jgi:hypothetical protein